MAITTSNSTSVNAVDFGLAVRMEERQWAGLRS
jgi:hypothetical protein